MLSIGKTPPDPLPCAIDDEKASPSSPDLTHNNNPSLNFSIRKYVFAARNKDISKNWPFSSKNLQLCLKHGVKDPLPPFQSLDNVRNQPFPRSSIIKTTASLNKEEISRRKSTEEPLRLNNDEVDTRSSDGLAVADNNLPSTTTSVSQIETESVPKVRKSNNNSASVKPGTLLGASVVKEVRGPTVSRKTETKKGRLVVKLGDRSLNEDIASTSTTTVSEAMGSKVCPVCKVFSSSSNTTLNAHIDQCLSEEPTPKWSAGSKLTRHRIKPRKTRLMVDIYETALHCTLEDLDRRNGSNWATGAGTSIPSQDAPDENIEKRQRVSSVNNTEEDVGAVYIDSKGTKLRILSKFGDSQPSSSGAAEALGTRKCSKGKRDRVLLLKKKGKKMKKKNAQKHPKYLKLVSRSKEFRSLKARLPGSQEFHDQEKFSGAREEQSDDTRLLGSRSLQPSDNGTLKQWASFRRSSPVKKVKDRDQRPRSGSTMYVQRDMPVEHGGSYFASSPGNDSDSSDVPRNDEISPGKRKLGSPLFYGRADGKAEGPNFTPLKRREIRSSEDFAFRGSKKTSFSAIPNGKSLRNFTTSSNKAMRLSRLVRKRKLGGPEKGSTPERLEMCSVAQEMSLEDQEDSDPSPTADFGCGTKKITEFSASFTDDESEKLDGPDSVADKGRDDHDNDVHGFELQYSKLGTVDDALNFSKYLNKGTLIENRRVVKKGLCQIDDQPFPEITEEDIGDDVTNRRVGSDVNTDSDAQARQEYEVERILIPGPPGSFLPSPGALGSEEYQGNSSSLTTSRVQSSQEPDLVDGHSSDSPISTTSTVSNSAPAGPETTHPELLQEKTTPGPSAIGVSSERKSIEKGPPISKKDEGQPCCCQRKDRNSNYAESQLLRRRNLGSLAAIGLGKPVNYPTSIHKGNEPLITKSPSAAVTNLNSDSATPSAYSSNPVLRLMGKNLMVVNNEEDASSARFRNSQPSGSWNNNPSLSSVSRMSGVSYSTIPISSAPPMSYTNGVSYFPNYPPRSNLVGPGSQDPRRPAREIIVIDDSPDDEIAKTLFPPNITGRGGAPRARQSFVAPPPVSYEPRMVGAAFPINYPLQDASSFFGQVPVSRRAAGSGQGGARWSSLPEGSGPFQRSSLVPDPPTDARTRSSLPSSTGM